jgi:hypothetical protein
MGFPVSVLCSGRPIELNKPHILALAAETGSLRFKEQVPFNFKNKISASSMCMEDLSIDITYDPC